MITVTIKIGKIEKVWEIDDDMEKMIIDPPDPGHGLLNDFGKSIVAGFESRFCEALQELIDSIDVVAIEQRSLEDFEEGLERISE